MRLFIAEKPSLGRAIAEVLPGPHKKCAGFLETGGGIVTWCFGHILEAAAPEEYDKKWAAWPGSSGDLPIVPKIWKLSPVPSAKAQLAVIRKLLSEASEIVHAGDPDREGQLLVDEVLEYLGNRKPVLRIWLSSLDEKSVRQALSGLRSNREFAAMKEAAQVRSRADWLVGMNLSRAYSIAARKNGNPVAVLSIGRVQTPTLKLVVDRDREIESFVSRDFFTVEATLDSPNGAFKTVWMPEENHSALDAAGRCIERAVALAVADGTKAQKGVLDVSKSEKSEPPPLPYALSTLTMDASKKYGMSAKEVLDTAQSLYEKKLTTYPRTDCEYLPQTQWGEAREILSALGRLPGLSSAASQADSARRSCAWNTEKVTAHHGIIPTREAGRAGGLSEKEGRIFDLVCRRYLAQFYPPFRYAETIVRTRLGGEPFQAKGTTLLEIGWKSVYGPESDREDRKEPEPPLPALSSGDTVVARDCSVVARETTPPSPYTDGTLVAAMKNVHRAMTNPEDKKILNETDGLGTEATRAAILETLFSRGYLEKSKRAIRSTPRGRALIDAVEPIVASPVTTAVWERSLESIAAAGRGENSGEFLSKIVAAVSRLTKTALTLRVVIPVEGKICPECGGVLRRLEGKFGPFLGCSGYPACRHLEKLPGAVSTNKRSPSRGKNTKGTRNGNSGKSGRVVRK